jgi:hypothetical protein
VKPIGAFFAPYPLLVGRWRPVLATALTLIVLIGLTALAFGTDVFSSFLTNNAVSRAPASMFTMKENQSLLATLARATRFGGTSASPLRSPAYIAMFLGIVMLTFALALKLGRARSSLGIALGVPAALLVYPQALEHYGFLLILPLLFLWTHLKELGVSPAAAILFLTAEYSLVRGEGGSLAFLGFALCWLMFVAIAIRAIRNPAANAPAQPPIPDTTVLPGAMPA